MNEITKNIQIAKLQICLSMLLIQGVELSDFDKGQGRKRNADGTWTKSPKSLSKTVEKTAEKVKADLEYNLGYDELASPEIHTREIIFHEAGHVLEMKQDAVSVSAAFREDRAAETPKNKQTPMPPGMGGMNGQTDAALDRFLSPYQGLRIKIGDSEIGTEVVSSSFEALGSPHLASRMAQVDPETLLYGLSLADKSPRS